MMGLGAILSRRRRGGSFSSVVVGILVCCACEGKKLPQKGVEATPAGNVKRGPAPPASPPPKAVTTTTTSPRIFRELAGVLPDEVDGYRPEGEDGHYGRDNLFDLINGGAEVYLALNVRAVVNRRYVRLDAPDVLVDVFDMGSASDAFGAFHHDMREGNSAGIGRESESGGSSLFFWKDRYYVSVVALADTPTSRAAVAAIGKAVADRTKGRGAIPELVKLLPPGGLISSQVHYFHTWQLLNRHYLFAKDNLLELGSDTEGVLARYRHGDAGASGGMPAVVLIRYPSEERAERAKERFFAGMLPGGEAEIRRTDKGWMGFRRRHSLLVGVFDAASESRVTELLAAVEFQRKGEQ